jgi:hypothetical protein
MKGEDTMDQTMTPSSERANPRDVAKATAIGGHFHDVVIGASKVLHAQELDRQDEDSLRWARDQLREAASREVIFTMPSVNQLTGPGNAVLALRRAARPNGGDPDDALSDLCARVDDVLRGKRDEPVLEAMRSLRRLFSLVSRLSLQTEISSQGDLAPGQSWALSTTTSRS